MANKVLLYLCDCCQAPSEWPFSWWFWFKNENALTSSLSLCTAVGIDFFGRLGAWVLVGWNVQGKKVCGHVWVSRVIPTGKHDHNIQIPTMQKFQSGTVIYIHSSQVLIHTHSLTATTNSLGPIEQQHQLGPTPPRQLAFGRQLNSRKSFIPFHT